ncbi:plancitoxin-1 [Trichinella spiralis]|uniref:plancitoxin-1 n=1 Tax=Trichinella spiralis TaxID=6334 RepID=UPI0001EFE205|nr:plancitoxin-1 [Trichinella spiralis]
MDARRPVWRESKNRIDDLNGSLALTLQPIYDRIDNTDTMLLMYNDAYPNNTVNWNAGHCKGNFDKKNTKPVCFAVIVEKQIASLEIVHIAFSKKHKLELLEAIFQVICISSTCQHVERNLFNHPLEMPILSVVAFDSSFGIWLIHSIPKFPLPTTFLYPNTGKVYGQTALCISFDQNALPLIAKQLEYNAPGVYASRLPVVLAQKIPSLANIISGVQTVQPPYYSITKLKSLGGRTFVHFAKHKKWKKELYVDLVAPTLKSELFVETWRHGGTENLPSNCSESFTVENINRIRFSDDVDFYFASDHSKWAVSQMKKKTVCIGDINRQKSQLNRSGGTMCISIKNIWKAFYTAVAAVELCPIPPY